MLVNVSVPFHELNVLGVPFIYVFAIQQSSTVSTNGFRYRVSHLAVIIVQKVNTHFFVVNNYSILSLEIVDMASYTRLSKINTDRTDQVMRDESTPPGVDRGVDQSERGLLHAVW